MRGVEMIQVEGLVRALRDIDVVKDRVCATCESFLALGKTVNGDRCCRGYRPLDHTDGCEDWQPRGPTDQERALEPLDSCTIDHLRDRFDPARRQRPKKDEQRLVAACWKCNNERGLTRQANIAPRTLHRRSGRYPQRSAVSP